MSQENRRCNEDADPVRWADGDPDHTAEECARKFAEVRPLVASDRDPGDEHQAPPRWSLPAFATGGSFVVGTAQEPIPAGSMVSLGADGKMFRVSPGERIHVRTPEQVARVRRPWWRRLFARIRRALTRRPQ